MADSRWYMYRKSFLLRFVYAAGGISLKRDKHGASVSMVHGVFSSVYRCGSAVVSASAMGKKTFLVI
jgi:hypothetical protein